jgi:hypothetical protein
MSRLVRTDPRQKVRSTLNITVHAEKSAVIKKVHGTRYRNAEHNDGGIGR